MFNTFAKFAKPAIKASVIGAVLAATPLVEAIPGLSTKAFAQNICADGKPFKSSRKNITMSKRTYRKYEKVLEIFDQSGELRKQIDMLKSQAKEAEALAATKTKPEEATEAATLRSQAQTFLSQVPALENQTKSMARDAESLIKDALNSSRTPDYDRASMLQLYSQINFERGDTKAAIKNLEDFLSYEAVFRETRLHGITYSVAQLNYSEEQYDRALDYLNDWFKLSDTVCHKVTTTQNTFIAQLYYVTKDYNKAISYMQRAIDEAEANPETDSKEQWYQLLASSYYELGNVNRYRDMLEIMVVKWSKPEYYKRLASVHQELGEDTVSYSLFEAIYEMGWMDNKPNEIKMVAQIQFARESSIKAAWIIESALRDGRMKSDTDNTRLLAQAYMSSYEFEKAVPPLTKVADELQDPELYLQVAGMEYGNGNSANAVRMFDKALALYKKKKKPSRSKIDSATLGKGAALLDQKKVMDACRVFQKLGRESKNRRIKRQVSSFKKAIEADIAREDMFSGNDTKRKCK
ncbi:hypothetical protein QGN29_00735 [Temperatibacter marinus]|uniref:Tetratricopeptide repeat protein n=1 Tax=Temperatibacter marinus TaxID=1456591 RepID=A0AA52H9U0_9PROT|nr:hypothetical protein [Temperatibacter marinus]WND02887.1 hypothetical protein QGN29_00735 [Temperatibacter marinus]